MLDHAPRIVSAPEQRMHLGKGDRMYVEGDVQGAAEFLIVRSTQRLRDPVSGEHLGDEVMQLGAAKLVRKAGDGLHAFFISDSRQEIVIGDRLLPHLPKSDESLAAGAPRNPGAALDALIVSVSDGAVHAAQHQVVSINKGARDQLMEGASFALYATADKLRRETKEQTPEQEPRLPEEESGRLLILRVFERVSYGLITQAVAPLRVGDKVRAPH
ncbi:hypothetical protein [Herbaspirillum sp. RV1423]|uniref:hypothetical protein n=1 Tax=Herbaspirillum sp. RV1423 TaxID=1443993 RepID=UPI0012DD669A|nr:hypothetical protein [Herbaspirillum sp. RV1423]